SGNAHHRAIVRYVAQYHGSRANPAVLADGDIAEQFGARTYRHVVANRRMTFTFLLASPAERYSLIDGDIGADNGGLADHNPHAVINKKPMSNECAGMDFDSGKEPHHLRVQSGKESHVVSPQPMGETVAPQSVQPRVAEEDLEHR